jgi:hypothetical protein
MHARATIAAAIATATAFLALAGAALVTHDSEAAAGPASPSAAVSALIDGVVAGDPGACKLLTRTAEAAFVRDAEPAGSCASIVQQLGAQPWINGLAGGRPTVTVATRDHAVVRLDMPTAEVFWFRAVPGPDGWLIARGPWDVRSV